MLVPIVSGSDPSPASGPIDRDQPRDLSFLAALVRALVVHPRPDTGAHIDGTPAQFRVASAPMPPQPMIRAAEFPPPGSPDHGGGDLSSPPPTAGHRPAGGSPILSNPILPAIGRLLEPVAVGAPLRLDAYPRPPADTGRGFHWIPTLHSDPSVVDRFVDEARKLGASWIVFLNDGSNIGNNDYLVRQLVDHGMEPVMRIYTSRGQPISGDLTQMVRHYVALGVHYFQPYNEPNLPEENPDGQVSVAGYVDRWIPAARAILAGGGLPGLGGLAPGAPVDDVGFLRSTIAEIKRRGAGDLLNSAWISMHNYTFNRPIGYQDDSNGFLKFRWYDQVVRDELGRSLPIIGTEGGPRLGDSVDPRYPAVDEQRRDDLVTAAFQYLGHREPYFFAQTQWVLANAAGGGQDPAWERDALYRPDGSPILLARDLQSQEVVS